MNGGYSRRLFAWLAVTTNSHGPGPGSSGAGRRAGGAGAVVTPSFRAFLRRQGGVVALLAAEPGSQVGSLVGGVIRRLDVFMTVGAAGLVHGSPRIRSGHPRGAIVGAGPRTGKPPRSSDISRVLAHHRP